MGARAPGTFWAELVGALAPDKLSVVVTGKERFRLVSNHSRSLLRQQPRAMTAGHRPKSGDKAQHSDVRGMLHDRARVDASVSAVTRLPTVQMRRVLRLSSGASCS